MSNYQRLISYIYTYEGGIKGKNIGFAKLETRGAQCRITVNVKKIFVGGNPIGVYLLSEKKEWRIGTLFARNGAGEFRATVSSADVENSGLGIEEFYGLSVHDVESAWRSYTTIWEDAVSHAAEVELADVTAENARKKQTPKALEQEIKKQNTLPISHEIEQALEREAPNAVREAGSRESIGSSPGFGAGEPDGVGAGSGGSEPDGVGAGSGDRESISAAPEVGTRLEIGARSDLAGTRSINAVPISGEQEQSDLEKDLTGEDTQPGPASENRKPWSTENAASKVVVRDLKNRHRDWSAAAVRNLRESLLRDQTALSVDSAAGCGTEPAVSQPISRPIPVTSAPEQPGNPKGPAPEQPRNPKGPAQEQPGNPKEPAPEQPGNLPKLQESAQKMGAESQGPGPMGTPGPMGAPGPGSMSAPGRRPMNGSLPQNRMGGRMMPGRKTESAPIQNGGNPGTAKGPQNQQPGTGEVPPADFGPGVQQEKDSTAEADMWEQLRKKYPKILAFDYADGCEVLSIKPQDIGLLPRETWLFGNNSFLLHGYYNYRYLILARLNNPKGKPRYLLGVPGHYYNNEKYMAGMFGFSDFVLAKKQQSGDGRFGYWYTDVKVGD